MWKVLLKKWKGLSIKQKAVIIGIATLIAFFPVIFIVILTSPLWIDNLEIGGSSGNSYVYNDYSKIKEKNTYWWPVGSSETREENGIIYADGEPVSITITSEYGMRVHPITGAYKLHTGTDIGAPMGADFVAAANGVVVKAEMTPAYGNMVIIDHGGGVQTLYAHGSEIVVQMGQEVKAGTPVLKVGSTGYSTGPHAHFEIRINGQHINPQNYIYNN